MCVCVCRTPATERASSARGDDQARATQTKSPELLFMCTLVHARHHHHLPPLSPPSPPSPPLPPLPPLPPSPRPSSPTTITTSTTTYHHHNHHHFHNVTTFITTSTYHLPPLPSPHQPRRTPCRSSSATPTSTSTTCTRRTVCRSRRRHGRLRVWSRGAGRGTSRSTEQTSSSTTAPTYEDPCLPPLQREGSTPNKSKMRPLPLMVSPGLQPPVLRTCSAYTVARLNFFYVWGG